MATENFTTSQSTGFSQSRGSDTDALIKDLVMSLTEDQCRSALKILKPLDRKMREEPALASQLLEAAEKAVTQVVAHG
jgi:hypothetical protein